MKKGRREARECVLKALYAQNYTQDRMEAVITDVMDHEELAKEFRDFAKDLAIRTHVHAEEFDDMIKQRSEHWDFNRIAMLDKLILRIAICEMLYFEEVPPKVSISEAIEIAKGYSTDNSGRFVNGILDSILTDLKKEGRIFVE